MFLNDKLTTEDLNSILSAKTIDDIEYIKLKADDTLKQYCGEKIYLRGLIEFSNICVNNCYYCGIRKSNKFLKRYQMSESDILHSAQLCANRNYGSIVLQSGERSDAEFISSIEKIIKKIKKETISDKLPHGLGITLCIGEQEYTTYKKLFAAGAHRYLLRIETSNEDLFKKLHPPEQDFKKRLECLMMLKDIGYQVGTGVMIGLPGQTIEDLVNDILFFEKLDIDMFGMGPYIIHKNTPMKIHEEEYLKHKQEIYLLSLKMIAATRIYLKDVNIASTTALQTMKPSGKEEGLSFGANVVMPLITPEEFGKEYILYNGKPCINTSDLKIDDEIIKRIHSRGRTIGFNEYGDSKHFQNKTEGKNG
jgi:biotin synthase